MNKLSENIKFFVYLLYLLLGGLLADCLLPLSSIDKASSAAVLLCIVYELNLKYGPTSEFLDKYKNLPAFILQGIVLYSLSLGVFTVLYGSQQVGFVAAFIYLVCASLGGYLGAVYLDESEDVTK